MRKMMTAFMLSAMVLAAGAWSHSLEAKPFQSGDAGRAAKAQSAATPFPHAAEARAKIQQVFADAVTMAEGAEAKIMIGDFNGDGSQDIAVVVRAASDKLDKLNDPYANWTVENPRRIRPPEMTRMTMRPGPHPPSRESIQAGDLLLAIIHGDGTAGWRNPKATQAFLLYHIVGKEMSVKAYKDVDLAPQRKRDLPPLREDVICQTLSGGPGMIYWIGGEYLWAH